jgi:hypothetical protein
MVDNSGQMRTIEAFFAVLLLFSTLAIATSTSPSVDSPNIEDLADTGRQAVFVMNEHGELSRLIDAENWVGLEQALASGLPTGVLFNVTVYDAELTRVNNITVSNGLTSDQDMISITCPCASQTSTLHLYLVQIQLGTME